MIHIISRYCKFSALSHNKARPSFFSREACRKNLLDTIKGYEDKVTLYTLFDGDPTGHFIENETHTKIKAGNGAKSFIKALIYGLEVGFENDIIYFVEDDYLHRPGWVPLLEEGCSISNKSYVSLYDHFDKYYRARIKLGLNPYEMYSGLKSEIAVTKSCHWRSVGSTTDTFAIPHRLLKQYFDTFMHFSSIAHHSLDHERGLTLQRMGLELWTSIPGYSTHMEPEYMSPLTDWESIQNKTHT